MAIANSTSTITVMTTATPNAVLYVVDNAASPVDEDDAASHVVDDAAAPHVIVDAAPPHVINDDAAPRSSSTPLQPASHLVDDAASHLVTQLLHIANSLVTAIS